VSGIDNRFRLSIPERSEGVRRHRRRPEWEVMRRDNTQDYLFDQVVVMFVN
jgi:hypothetical protein